MAPTRYKHSIEYRTCADHRLAILYESDARFVEVCLPDCGKLRPLHITRAIFRPMARLPFVCNARLLGLRSPSAHRRNSTAQIQQRLGLIGSGFATTLLTYGIARFEDNGRLGAYQPNTFDRINGTVSKPVMLLFLFSSLASLVISALITVRLRNRTGSASFTESSGN